MISSLPLAIALTALFAATGVYALLRWSEAVAAAHPPLRRTSELAHLLMSAAMVVMTWTWFGTTAEWVQILLFGGFAVWFAVIAVQRRRRPATGCPGAPAHALMAAAMAWMVAAMPLIMPMPMEASASAGGHSGHAGHGAGHEGMTHAAGQAGWAVAVTVLLCVALLGAAGFWAARALASGARTGDDATAAVPAARSALDDTGETPSAGAGDTPAACAGAGPDSASGAAGAERASAGTGAVAVAERDRSATGTAAVAPSGFGPRTDAGCHALMSAGMVLMLVAMVAGW
ncbi:DUF5134 domain-containing protein [Pseudonocardia nematodicida]|uniref:DUF5134 domain-containing protein n=1 Tax=Pseudonocardia nematodicida TaxID=1206997 RepID=A0ABV1KL74_9PSEU